MEWREFTEGSIRKVGYAVATGELRVLFASGGLYQYDAVPKDVADGLINAQSKGGYLFANIRDKFPYRCLHRAPKKEPKPDAETKTATQEEAQPIRTKRSSRTRQPI